MTGQVGQSGNWEHLQTADKTAPARFDRNPPAPFLAIDDWRGSPTLHLTLGLLGSVLSISVVARNSRLVCRMCDAAGLTACRPGSTKDRMTPPDSRVSRLWPE